ncbi:hypothetical protein O181_036793 [Austropuccinia psidii MF-1]|uniref:Secreted protein n=1 Tax=Austropuccinia psidii MF-1 TaxID=1389203 RepID=A0A9Q3H9I3_9BASI|nr:hypothetical protein [Austropuccinia psidii MF-1]
MLSTPVVRLAFIFLLTLTAHNVCAESCTECTDGFSWLSEKDAFCDPYNSNRVQCTLNNCKLKNIMTHKIRLGTTGLRAFWLSHCGPFLTPFRNETVKPYNFLTNPSEGYVAVSRGKLLNGKEIKNYVCLIAWNPVRPCEGTNLLRGLDNFVYETHDSFERYQVVPAALPHNKLKPKAGGEIGFGSGVGRGSKSLAPQNWEIF